MKAAAHGLARAALLSLLALALGWQGASLAFDRVAEPAHRHRLVAAGGVTAGTPDRAAPPELGLGSCAGAQVVVHDDHRSLPCIDRAAPQADAPSHAQSHATGVAHAHALDDHGVVYLDADGEAGLTHPPQPQPTANGLALLLATEPLPSFTTRPAAPQPTRGWHVLALSGQPLERPPR